MSKTSFISPHMTVNPETETNERLTLKGIENIIWVFTVKTLGLDPLSDFAQETVRIGYGPEGQPGWKRTDDQIFILVTTVDDPYVRQTEITYMDKTQDDLNLVSSYTRVLQVSWTLYGPNSFDNADVIRNGLYTQVNSFEPLKLVTSVPASFRLPELFAGQWWERSTLTARFNEKVVRRNTVNYIDSADIKVIPNR